MSVTAVCSLPAYTPHNRNVEALEHELAVLGEELGLDPRHEPARRRALRSAYEGGSCGACGRAFEPGEPIIWTVPLPRRHHVKTPCCGECGALETFKAHGWSGRPCGGCERPVYDRYDGRRRYCSNGCRKLATYRGQLQKAAGARRKGCAVCDRPFTPPRSDALTCSPACRQKAYRRRQAVTGAPPRDA